MNVISQIFHHMPGVWTFQRVISGFGNVQGQAFFKKLGEANTLTYREEGVLTALSGQVNNVYRNYIYRYENGQISVYFEDNRPFHTLQFSQSHYPASATARHHCGCDVYDAVYTFFSEGKFKLYYAVKGPKKDYTITTDFIKTGDGK